MPREIMTPEQVHFCLEAAEQAIGEEFSPRFYCLCEKLGELGAFDAFWEALAETIEHEDDQTKWISMALERMAAQLKEATQ